MTSKRLEIRVDQTGNAERGLGAISGSLGTIGKVAGGVALGGIVALGAGILGTAASGFDLNNSVEQATATINAFTKDGAKTEQILEMIRRRAAETPFAFNEMATAAGALIPSAKQAGVALEELIQEAEILAASNPAQGLEGAAFALKEAVSGDFTSIIERFNLPRQYINQLKEEGVPALEIVRKAMGELGLDTDLVSSLAATASGRWSTFKDTVQGIAAQITKPIFDAFSNGLGVVNRLLAANEPALKALANQILPTVEGAFTRLGTIIGKVVEAFERFGIRGAAISILGQLGLSPENVAQALLVADTIVAALDTIRTAYEKFGVRGATVSLLGQLGLNPESIAAVLNKVDSLTNGLQQLGTWMLQLGQIVLPLYLRGWRLVLENMNVIGPIIAAVGVTVLALSSPLTLVTGAVIALATAWANNWGDIQGKTRSVLDFLKPYWNDLSAIFSNFTAILLPELRKVWLELVLAWNTQVKPALKDLWSSLQQLITPLRSNSKGTGDWQIVLAAVKLALASVVIGIRSVIPYIRTMAEVVRIGINGLSSFLDMLRSIRSAADRMSSAMRSVTNSIRDAIAAAMSMPDWLIPGSPTPFEIGLQGIARAANKVRSALPEAFNVGVNNPIQANPIQASGIRSAREIQSVQNQAQPPITVNLTYAPTISTADSIEVEQVLFPFIKNGLRLAGVNV